MSLSFRMTISRDVHRAGVVHRLIGHAGAHRAVADHGDDVVLAALADRAPTAMPRPAEIEVELCAAPNGSYSLSARRVNPDSPPPWRKRADAVAPPGEDLVRIGLVADIPDQPVARRVEDVMQRDGQLDHAQARRPRWPPVTDTASTSSRRSSSANCAQIALRQAGGDRRARSPGRAAASDHCAACGAESWSFLWSEVPSQPPLALCRQIRLMPELPKLREF